MHAAHVPGLPPKLGKSHFPSSGSATNSSHALLNAQTCHNQAASRRSAGRSVTQLPRSMETRPVRTISTEP